MGKAGLLGKLLDLVCAQSLLKLLRSDGEMLSGTNPRMHDIAQAALLEILHQVSEAAPTTDYSEEPVEQAFSSGSIFVRCFRTPKSITNLRS